MIIKERSILYLYILLWFLYELQGVFWTEGNGLSLAIILALTAISLSYAIKVNCLAQKLPLFLKALNIMVLMLSIYGVVYVVEGPGDTIGVTQGKPYNYLKAIYNSLLPIYTFYYFAKIGVLNHRLLTRLVIFFFLMTIVSYLHMEEVVKAKFEAKGMEKMDIVNYECYTFLSLFSVLTVYYKRPWIQYVGIIVIMTFIFMGMKRGAILVGVICTAWYSYELFKNAKGFKKLLILIVSTSVVLLLSYWVFYLLETNEFFNRRIQSTLEGDTSGRDRLFYAFYYHFIYNTDALHFLFGSGANATLSVSFNYAHNDWLELAVNQGVLGLALYAFFWYTFFRSWKLMDRRHYTHFAFGLLILICFLKTLFSRTYSDMDIYTTCMLGYCLGIGNTMNPQNSDVK